MAYEFKNLNEVPTKDAPTENTTVMAFEGGSPIQIPATEFGGKGMVVDLRSYTLNTDGNFTVISDINYDPIYEAIMNGQNVLFMGRLEGIDVCMNYLFSGVFPGEGLAFALISPNSNIPIRFTNGSYHTTA